MINPIDAMLPSYEQISYLSSSRVQVQIQLATGLWLKGTIQWQDRYALGLESLCGITYVLYKNSVACISFSIEDDNKA